MDFEKIVSEVRSELWKRNIPFVDCEVVISKRLRKAFGNTGLKIQNGERIYKIQIADYLVRNGSEEFIKNTIAHEYLHTCPDCMNHGEQWKEYAKQVADVFTITTYGNYADAGISNEQMREIRKPKYIAFCTECGCEWHYKRFGKVLQNIDECECPYCKKKTLDIKKLY